MELNKIPLKDQHNIRNLLNKVRQLKNTGRPYDIIEKKINELYVKASELVLKKERAKLRLSYPVELPISSKKDAVKDLILSNQVVIVSGSTGSGKTTQIPKILVEAGYGRLGRIGCTQPRRIAAAGMAKRVAEETGAVFGREVGCKVRFSDNTSEETIIKFMTDGIMLAETASDKLLLQYDAIIIDEAHERSLNIDFLIGYIKNILPKRPDLKIVISSATLNTRAFSEFFSNAPLIEIEGRVYPIDDVFLTPYEDEELSSHVLRGVEYLRSYDAKGDILVFLPGEKEIRECDDVISGQRYPHTEVMPLYSKLSMNDQLRIFKRGFQKRIILATNVAETSITIPGIKYVIDSGLVRISRYDPRSRIQSLQIEMVSQASAQQRRGRCGREHDGICLHLYDDETLKKATEYTDPEICRTSLAEVILQMMSLNLPDIDAFELIDQPKASLIREGYKTLYDIGAIDTSNKITAEGKSIACFSIDPQLAKMVSRGNIEKSLNEMIIISSFLSLQDPRERPLARQAEADNLHKRFFNENSDYLTILKIWNFFEFETSSNSKIRRLCKDNFFNYRRVKEWNNLYSEIAETAEDMNWKIDKGNQIKESYDYASIHRCVISAFPSNIGMKTEKGVYQGASGIKFNIFPGSNIFKTLPKWMVAFSLLETTKLYARIAASIACEWIESALPHLCKFIYKDIHWDKKRGFVSALESVAFKGLLINEGRRVHYGRIDLREARKIFINDALVTGDFFTWHLFLKTHKKMLDDITTLESKIRRPESLFNREAVFEHFDKTLPFDVCSVKTLEDFLQKSGKNITMRAEDAIYEPPKKIDEFLYPDSIEFLKTLFPLKYTFNPGEDDDGVTLRAGESDLNKLPEWISDYIVPGYLEDKVRFLIRSLPKSKRILCNPLQEMTDKFTANFMDNEKKSCSELLTSLSVFLTKETGARINSEDFQIEGMPEYLKIKIAVTDEKTGKTTLYKGLPERENSSSKIEFSDKGTTKKEVYNSFPPAPIPLSVIVDINHNISAYPALTSENGKDLIVSMYADEREAKRNHKMGLISLFKSSYKEQYEYLFKKLPVKNYLSLTLYELYKTDKFKTSLCDEIIFNAISDSGRVDIRGSEEFNERAKAALNELFPISVKFISTLESVMESREKVFTLLQKITSVEENVVDTRKQISLLFYSDFISSGFFFQRYQAYMKAFLLRIERYGNSPSKDLSKFQEIKYHQLRFDQKFESSNNRIMTLSMLEALRLLQEFRIKIFAPEIATQEKISPKILEEKLSELLQEYNFILQSQGIELQKKTVK